MWLLTIDNNLMAQNQSKVKALKKTCLNNLLKNFVNSVLIEYQSVNVLLEINKCMTNNSTTNSWKTKLQLLS